MPQITTHIYGDVPEPDGAVCDEACVDGVEVGVSLHVGDECGHAHQPDHQDRPNHRRVEALVRTELLKGQAGAQFKHCLSWDMALNFSLNYWFSGWSKRKATKEGS